MSNLVSTTLVLIILVASEVDDTIMKSEQCDRIIMYRFHVVTSPVRDGAANILEGFSLAGGDCYPVRSLS